MILVVDTESRKLVLPEVTSTQERKGIRELKSDLNGRKAVH